QGNIRKALECRVKPGDRALESARKKARGQYEMVCRRTLLFFDAHLKGDVGRHDELARLCAAGERSPRPNLVHVPRGFAGAEPYRTHSAAPPTPRQIRELMGRLGVEPTLDLLERHREKDPTALVLRGEVGFAIVDEFIEQGRTRDAIAV